MVTNIYLLSISPTHHNHLNNKVCGLLHPHPDKHIIIPIYLAKVDYRNFLSKLNLSVFFTEAGSHAPIVDPYSWQRVSQQGPPQSHHPPSLSSSHDRSRNNIPSNQRMPILPSSQPPPPPSSRGNTSGQTHLYSHPGVPLNTLPTSQQHASLAAAPPPSLRHPTTYLTQQTSPTGLVLHPTGQTRPYEQHYVVAPSLSQRRF